jgi:hypothetical protein
VISPKTSLHLLLAVACFVIAAASVGCGKRRPPLPPIERVQQRTELLSGAQQGNEVILSWPAPSRNAADSSVQSIRRIDVYRLAERPGAPLALTEEEFAARSTLVGSVTYEQLQTAGDTLTYRDALELAGQPTRLRYAIRYVNASGQRAAFSNFLTIEPAGNDRGRCDHARVESTGGKHRRLNAGEPARVQRVPDGRIAERAEPDAD